MSQASKCLSPWKFGGGLVLLASAYACGSSPSTGAEDASTARARLTGSSLCGSRAADQEIEEARGPDSDYPKIRKVFRVRGLGPDAKRTLVCREADLNLDGKMDSVRTYDDSGAKLEEQSDSNLDGKIDTWLSYSGDKLSRVEWDKSGDGVADEVRYYVNGQLVRIQRDSNLDGRPDVFEMYQDSHLERMGYDLDFDGQVDRWDRDEAKAQEAERAAAATATKKSVQNSPVPTETSLAEDELEPPAPPQSASGGQLGTAAKQGTASASASASSAAGQSGRPAQSTVTAQRAPATSGSASAAESRPPSQPDSAHK